MTRLQAAARRVIPAVAAAATTLVRFSAVVGLAEPRAAAVKHRAALAAVL